MNIQNKSRKQDAVYWPVLVDDQGRKVADANGQPRYDSPRETKVKWIDSNHLITGTSGEQIQSKAFLIVDATIEFRIGDMMFRGLLSDLPEGTEDSPKLVEKASQILSIDDLTNIRGNTRVKMVHL